MSHSYCTSLFTLLFQTIGSEIAAHEATVEEMRRRNVANLPPPTTDGKAARGGTMLDQLQVTLTPTGEHQKVQRVMPPLHYQDINNATLPLTSCLKYE